MLFAHGCSRELWDDFRLFVGHLISDPKTGGGFTLREVATLGDKYVSSVKFIGPESLRVCMCVWLCVRVARVYSRGAPSAPSYSHPFLVS